jgi:hypothetical protein
MRGAEDQKQSVVVVVVVVVSVYVVNAALAASGNAESIPMLSAPIASFLRSRIELRPRT